MGGRNRVLSSFPPQGNSRSVEREEGTVGVRRQKAEEEKEKERRRRRRREVVRSIRDEGERILTDSDSVEFEDCEQSHGRGAGVLNCHLSVRMDWVSSRKMVQNIRPFEN